MILYAEGILEWELGVIHDFICNDILRMTSKMPVRCNGQKNVHALQRVEKHCQHSPKIIENWIENGLKWLTSFVRYINCELI